MSASRPPEGTGAPASPGEDNAADDGCYEVYAIRYGHHARTAAHNFITTPSDHEGDMPMDYFVWLVRNGARAVLVDTGFSPRAAQQRQRDFLRCPTEGMRRLGVEPATVQDVVITHLHYDHAGNTDLYPNARFHVQDREMQFATGRYMCHGFLRLAYDVEDIKAMVQRLFDGRLAFVDGDAELAPGLSLHHVGGHTAGLQVVRVRTRQGWLVLASDAFHYYANRHKASPFPIVFHAGEMLEGFTRVGQLASEERLVVPGHDPLVMRRFAAEPRDAGWTVRLHEPL